MNLRIKVLFPVTLMILMAMIVALVIVNHVVRRQVLQGVANELHRSKRVFEELVKREREVLLDRGWVVAEAPHLKAAVDTGDPTTVQRVLEEHFKTVRSDILIVVDHANRVLAQRGLHQPLNELTYDSFTDQTRSEEDFHFLKIQDAYYQVASLPIVSPDAISGVFILGHVIFGNALDDAYLTRLKKLVKCDIVFFLNNEIIVTTLNLLKKNILKQLLTPITDHSSNAQKLMIGKEEVLTEWVDPEKRFLLIQSVDAAFQPIMQPIEKTMVFATVFAFLIAIFISSYISYEVLTPVKKLVQATNAIMQGDYKHKIEARSKDEIGHLARKFDEMRRTLKQKMQELQEQNVQLQTALKKLEVTQEELVRTEKLAATGKITAQLSHELNNPIHNIQSCLETAQKRLNQNNAAREFIDLAHQEVLRIGKLVREMLNFYQPKITKKQPVQIQQILEEIIKTVQHLIMERNIQFSTKFEPDLPIIYASRDQLKQVFLNLIFNAMEAMPEGGRLSISAFQDTQYLCVSIKDTGCGIPPENLNKIFDAFFTTKAQTSGVGLGLSVSYGIVKSHGGNIEVESQPNQGSSFVVKLPIVKK